MLGRQVVPRGNEHTAAQSPSSTGSGPLRDSRPALADTVFSLSVVTESFRKTYNGRVQKRGQTGLRIVMAIHRDGKRLGGAVAAVLSLALSAVLMVPGWVWADCCCLKESTVQAELPDKPSCCQKSKAPTPETPQQSQWQNECGCDARVADWQATLPVRTVIPDLSGAVVDAFKRNASGSAVCERQLATWAQENPPPGTDRVLLCRWLA